MSKAKRTPKPEPKPGTRRRLIVAVAAGLLLLTLAVYIRVPSFDFVNLDDNVYVYDNALVKDGLTAPRIGEAFRTYWQCNWHPLTWMSLMADTQILKWAEANDISLGNERAGVYHITNLALHLASVLMLFLLLHGLTGRVWPSAFVATLFGIHPMHVESVAWVAERKDVLSTFFWMLTMLAYARYVRKPSVLRYVPIVLLYGLGLMAKPMLVTLPLVLLLLDLWPLGRLKGPGDRGRSATDIRHPTPVTLVLEKVPLLLMTAASCAVTVIAQAKGRGMVPVELMSIGVRAANASVSAVHYILKMLWPAKLACLYPHPIDTIPTWMVPASAASLAVVTFVAIKLAKSRPYVTVGWLWYLITLIPVCGMVQVGRQQMADRYSYIPLIGLFILIAWLVQDVVRAKWLVAGAAVVVVAASAMVCWRQVGYWSDSVTLMTHTAHVTCYNYVAENNIAQALYDRGDIDGAFLHVRRSLAYNPEFIDALFNYGTLLVVNQQYAEAEPVFHKLISLKPEHAGAHNNLARLMIFKHDIDGAIEHFRAAARAEPGNQTYADNLARAEAFKQHLQGR